MEELLFGVVFILIVIDVIYGLVTGGSSSKHSYDDDFEFQRECNQRQFDEHNRWAMEEGRKSVTPFEMGGYDMTQGNSWNNDCGGGGFNNFGGMF